jgi:hypothetical protein
MLVCIIYISFSSVQLGWDSVHDSPQIKAKQYKLFVASREVLDMLQNSRNYNYPSTTYGNQMW